MSLRILRGSQKASCREDNAIGVWLQTFRKPFAVRSDVHADTAPRDEKFLPIKARMESGRLAKSAAFHRWLGSNPEM